MGLETRANCHEHRRLAASCFSALTRELVSFCLVSNGADTSAATSFSGFPTESNHGTWERKQPTSRDPARSFFRSTEKPCSIFATADRQRQRKRFYSFMPRWYVKSLLVQAKHPDAFCYSIYKRNINARTTRFLQFKPSPLEIGWNCLFSCGPNST